MAKKKKIPAIVKQIQKHTLKEIVYGVEKSISYSQMSTFLSCPHKWSLQYRDGYYTSEASINMTFGTALHEVLQHYITVIYNVSGAEADRIDLEAYFEERFRETYLKDYKSNKNVHFSDPVEMREFYEDGIEIIKTIKKLRSGLFSKQGWYLVGCEIPILITPIPEYKNVLYKGYLDVVLYHEPTNSFKIMDIKTSTKGWDDKTKKDDIKQFQLILYKKYFAKQFGLEEDNIEIEFFIVKRKVWEDAPYPISRLQEFRPPSGKIKTNRATKTVEEFITKVFNHDGTHKTDNHSSNPSKWNCRYCPFGKDKNLCKDSIL